MYVEVKEVSGYVVRDYRNSSLHSLSPCLIAPLFGVGKDYVLGTDAVPSAVGLGSRLDELVWPTS
jgi:hypothetical protein